jgi:hypothetical protein
MFSERKRPTRASEAQNQPCAATADWLWAVRSRKPAGNSVRYGEVISIVSSPPVRRHRSAPDLTERDRGGLELLSGGLPRIDGIKR